MARKKVIVRTKPNSDTDYEKMSDDDRFITLYEFESKYEYG